MVERIEERAAALEREVSERSRAEQALRESEQRFRSLVEQAADGIFLVRQDGSLKDVNEETCHSLGYTRQELLELSVRDVVPGFPWRAFEDLWKGSSSRPPMTIEGLHRRKDGATFPVEFRLGLIESGSAEYVLALARDISDRKEAEEAKRRAEEQLETQRSLSVRADRLRSLGEMAAVRGLAEHVLIGMAKGWDLSPDKVRDRLSGIVDQADRMTHIIEHVRMFAREADAPTVESVQVNEVVRSAVEMLAAQFKTRGLGIDFDLAEDLPPVEANAYSLEEVVLNLMSNARDAMEEAPGDGDRSEPRLRLRTRLVGEERDGQSVTIEVQDNGAGIREDILDKVFDPFFTTKDPDKGTGLGLAICKSIVEGVGGRVHIQSNPGQGTTLTIFLPPAVVSDSPLVSQG
jgi:PAS domain S-box-containing protein